MAQNIYEKVTNMVIESLAKGVAPWQKPWSMVGGEGKEGGLAINYTTRRPYSLLNQWFLKGGEYLSFNDVNKLGGKVKKGAKSHEVYAVFRSWKNKEDGSYSQEDHSNDEDWKVCFSFRFYRVFHIEDTEGIPSKIKDMPQPTETIDPIDSADSVIKAYVEREGIKFHNNASSNSAFYAPRTDEVVVPCLRQYKHKEEYYSTAFHELTHSSGAEKRLNRKGIVEFDTFGSEQYSKEELIAEMGSAFLMNTLGISTDKCFNNSVAYLQGWAKKLKEDTTMIVWAAQSAEKACEYIMNGKKK